MTQNTNRTNPNKKEEKMKALMLKPMLKTFYNHLCTRYGMNGQVDFHWGVTELPELGEHHAMAVQFHNGSITIYATYQAEDGSKKWEKLLG